MNFVDIILILVALFGLYIGYNAGILKGIVDSVVFFCSTLVASIVSKLACKYLITILPFFNFFGKAAGIKSINIILWRIIFHVLILLVCIFAFDKLSKKVKLKDKLTDTMVEAGIFYKLFGVLCYIPVIVIFMFNMLLVLWLPNLNFKSFHESVISNTILEKTVVLNKLNSGLYTSEKFATEKINEENTIDTYSDLNDEIASNLVENDLATDSQIEKLSSDNKLLGKRTEDKNNDSDDSDTDDSDTDDSYTDDSDTDDSDTDDDSDDSDDYSDDDYSDDDYSDDDYSDDDYSDDDYYYDDSEDYYYDDSEY